MIIAPLLLRAGAAPAAVVYYDICKLCVVVGAEAQPWPVGRLRSVAAEGEPDILDMVRRVGELNALPSPPIHDGFGAEQAERYDEMAHCTEEV